MKKLISLLLALTLLLALAVPAAYASGAYEGKTVVLYTGNLRGNIDLYAQIAAAKADYLAQGAEVVLVDAGNHLQGTAYANSSRGADIYTLMDAVGYDVAAMGQYDFVYGAATTGYPYHGNFYKYYTQAELYRGTEELTYKVNARGTVTETRAARQPASFQVIASYAAPATGYYAFAQNATVETKAGKLGFVTLTGCNTDLLQDGWMDGYTAVEGYAAAPGGADLVIGLSSTTTACSPTGAAISICAPAADETFYGAYVIDNASRKVTAEAVKLGDADKDIAAQLARIKEAASPVVGSATVTLQGADNANRNRETNLGDLTTDALLWYAQNKFDGFRKDVPVVALQNGGNCDQFIYPGDITEVDLLCALPFSPMGVGILYLTGAELLETLEAATQTADCAGFAQSAGLKYTVATYKNYDAGAEYGKFFQAKSINRVTIEKIGGKPFDEKATYAVIADNFLMNGNDTYYLLKNVKEAHPDRYLNNGTGVKTRDIVAMYIKAVLNGTVGETYAQPAGRIQVQEKAPEQPFVNPFRDVTEQDWYYDAVAYTCQRKLMLGVAADEFAPSLKMSRAMLVTVLYRLEGSPEASSFDNPFADVKSGEWYTDAVCWAAKEGVVKGMSETSFAPKGDLTREQCATIFYRYAQTKGMDTTARGNLTDFPDGGDTSPYAQTPMQWAIGSALIQGTDEGHGTILQPQGTATRAQLATILARFAERLPA